MSSPTAASRLCTAQSTSPVRIDAQAGPPLLERFADLQSRCIDPDTFDAADFELWQALDDHAREGSGVLDLRSHGEALMRVPGELMEAFFDVCRCQSTPLQAMYLPSELSASADWVRACPDDVLIVQEAQLST
jgi:hypothetical protein